MNKTICPYLSTNGNKYSHKGFSEGCIYSKDVKKCPHYNQWDKNRIIDSRGSQDYSDTIQETTYGI